MATISATPTIARRGRPLGGIQAKTKSDAVVRVRAVLNLTQEQFAAELGCGTSTLRRYEQNSLLPASGAVKATFGRFAKRAGVQLEV